MMNEYLMLHVLTLTVFYWIAFWITELQDFLFDILLLTIVFLLIYFTGELLNVIQL